MSIRWCSPHDFLLFLFLSPFLYHHTDGRIRFRPRMIAVHSALTFSKPTALGGSALSLIIQKQATHGTQSMGFYFSLTSTTFIQCL
ncbi:MAG: hypothetical protein NTV50_00345 [Planctomycetota bacterium]|nr:hypothetical protein [Planctomycetota bacterium]